MPAWHEISCRPLSTVNSRAAPWRERPARLTIEPASLRVRCADLLRPALHMMNRLAVDRDRFRILEFLDFLGRQLRPVHRDR